MADSDDLLSKNSKNSKRRKQYWALATLGLREQLEIESSELWLGVEFVAGGDYIAVNFIAFEDDIYGGETFYVRRENI